MRTKIYYGIILGIFSVILTGCSNSQGNVGDMTVYAVSSQEAKWIKDGEPIEFEGESWYPQDGFEILLDSEVDYVGTYKEVEFFINKADVRPYSRLYTKFGRNKFRYFETKNGDD